MKRADEQRDSKRDANMRAFLAEVCSDNVVTSSEWRRQEQVLRGMAYETRGQMDCSSGQSLLDILEPRPS